MRAMDYIRSKNICYLLCDTLKMIDERPIAHGMRVAYMLMRIMENKGGYDEYEVAEFAFLAMIHDIGVYRTEKELLPELYDAQENARRHAVYGALFLKKLSPFGERAYIIRCHHMPYSETSKLNYQYNRVAAYLHMLEDVDAAYCKDGVTMDLKPFESGAGSKYPPEGVMSLLQCVRREGMLQKIASGEYEAQLSRYMENVLFTNEEKEGYLKLVMQCCGFKGKLITVESIMCRCIAEVIAEDIGLSGREKDKMDYAAILHNIGMLGMEKDDIKALRNMETENSPALEAHIKKGCALLDKYFAVKDIVEIISAHHERGDGSGYPQGKRGNEMTPQQSIMQVADYMTMLMNKRKDGKQLSKREVIDLLSKKADRNQLNEDMVRCVINRYDMLERRIHTETKNYLEMYVRLGNTYKRNMEGKQEEYE